MFKKATEKHIPLIQNLAKKSWETTYSGIISQQQINYMLDLMYSESTLKNHFNNPYYRYYLIDSENKFLGFAGFEFHSESSTTKLHRIYFLQEARGKGLGKKTIEFIKNKALEMEDHRLILTVNKNNNAQRFYESLGFKTYDEAVFDIGNGYVMDDYLMELIF